MSGPDPGRSRDGTVARRTADAVDGPAADGTAADNGSAEGSSAARSATGGSPSTEAGGDASDRALLAAHVNGDRQAFATLVERHASRLWAVALRTTGDREDASDALQDALLAAHRSAAGYRGEARVTTWLHRIVVNACLDRLRRRAARPTVPLSEHDADPRLAERRDALAERETALEVESALRALPDDQRLAIVLVDLQGMSVAEAAAVLQVPVGTVKSRCSRGRTRLALLLGHLRNRTDAAGVEPAAAREPARRPDRSGGQS